MALKKILFELQLLNPTFKDPKTYFKLEESDIKDLGTGFLLNHPQLPQSSPTTYLSRHYHFLALSDLSRLIGPVGRVQKIHPPRQ